METKLFEVKLNFFSLYVFGFMFCFEKTCWRNVNLFFLGLNQCELHRFYLSSFFMVYKQKRQCFLSVLRFMHAIESIGHLYNRMAMRNEYVALKTKLIPTKLNSNRNQNQEDFCAGFVWISFCHSSFPSFFFCRCSHMLRTQWLRLFGLYMKKYACC